MLLSEAKRILLNAGYRLDEGKNGPSLARVIKDWIKNNTEYTALIKDMGVTKGETSSGEKNKTYKIVLKKTPIPANLILKMYDQDAYVSAEGDRFSTKSYKIEKMDDLKQVIDELEDVFNGSLDENFEGDTYMDIEDSLSNMGYGPLEIKSLMTDFADLINDYIEDGLSADEIAEKLSDNEE